MMLGAALAALALCVAGVEPPAAEASPVPSQRRYVVERILLSGLDRTRPSEVRRHLAVAEGDLLDDGAVTLSRLRLLQLGWFSRVETRVEKGSERGQVVLVFELAERNTLVVTDLVVGSTGPQPLYGGLGLSEGNFLGRGLVLGGAFVYGGTPADQPLAPARFSVRASLLAPDVDVIGRTVLLGVTALFLRGEELTCADAECAAYRGRYGAAPRLRYDRLGGEVTIGFRPGPFQRILTGFRAERLGATAVAAPGAPTGPAPLIRGGRSWLTALSATYDRDTRDEVFLPRSGSRVALGGTFGTQALGGDYEFSRIQLSLESDHGLPWNHAVRLSGALGAVQGDAPFFERFYAADFAYFTVGPALGRALELNFSTDSRYDSYLAALGAEYAIPLWASGGFFHRGYAALGARWVYTAARARGGRTPASSSPFSGELALRLDTPVGRFNVSLGYALDNVL